METTTLKALRQQLDAGLISMSEAIGQRVKVGFLSLTVTDYQTTPGDYLPNVWYLRSDNGAEYEFTPHNGLWRVN